MTSTQDDPSGVFSVFKQDINRTTPFYCRWTTEEDNLLMEAVKKHGPHKWSLIAQHVPDRTPVQCSTRWLGALNPNVQKGRWSPDEDEALMQAVKKYGNKGVLPWNRIAQNIPNRTGIQCQARWTEALDPTVRKGRWKAEEDEMLRAAVARFGCCWIRVSGMIFGRTQRQTRTRWNQIKSRKEKANNKKLQLKDTTMKPVEKSASKKKEQQQQQQSSPSPSSSSLSSPGSPASPASPISLMDSLSSPTFSLEEKSFSPLPPFSPPTDVQQDQQIQWMNFPHSINVPVDSCETDYFCLSPPSPSSSLDEMLTLPDDDLDSVDHDSNTQPTSATLSHIPCEFYRFDPELPSSSLTLPESDLMFNDLLSHSLL